MSESESSNTTTEYGTAHFELLNEIDNIKTKVTDMEYKNIMDKMANLRKCEKVMFNKSIILDIQYEILKTFITPADGDNTINLAQLRPLEAINYMAEFANIILNIETMTNETEEEFRKISKEFIFKQLGTSHTGDYHRTILQIVSYERLKRIVNLIESLEI